MKTNNHETLIDVPSDVRKDPEVKTAVLKGPPENCCSPSPGKDSVKPYLNEEGSVEKHED